MHNIDRTNGEFGQEFGYEYENEFGQEFGHEYEGEFANEFGQELSGEYSYEAPVFHEAMEMELATELLSVSNEAEMEQFLGKLFRGAVKGVGNFVRSPVGRSIGGMLKSVAKTALPIAGKALGSMVGGPVGGMIGGKLGSMATNLFELELEGLSNEDKEFEMARAYVRFAGDAARRGARNTGARSNPSTAAKQAITASARRHAPGLLKNRRCSCGNTQSNMNAILQAGASSGAMAGSGNNGGSGSWYRQGNQIIINL